MAITTAEAAALCARVYALVQPCPAGRVTTYGAIGAALGYPRGARMIGWIMNATPGALGVPAQRVVGKDGTLTGSWAFGGVDAYRALLESEGVSFDDKGRVNMRRHEWDPNRDLTDDDRERILAASAALVVEPPATLLRLLNRDPASPFKDSVASM